MAARSSRSFPDRRLVVLFLLFGRGMLGGAEDATDINADIKVESSATTN